MARFQFPPLPLQEWESTRNTLQRWVKVMSVIRGAFSPKEKHWWQDSLRVSVNGIETPPVPAPEGSAAHTFAIHLNLAATRVEVHSSTGARRTLKMQAASAAAFFKKIQTGLKQCDVELSLDHEALHDETVGELNPEQVRRYWQALCQVDLLFKRFKAGLREESGPVRFWSDHFDLALLWFSGRRVPGQDPDDPEYADEQMNFGFSTGDEVIPEPYFYITAYPLPDALPALQLPPPARWQTKGWQGAVLPYAALVGASDPERTLLDFLQTVHAEARRLMLG